MVDVELYIARLYANVEAKREKIKHLNAKNAKLVLQLGSAQAEIERLQKILSEHHIPYKE